LALDPHTPVLVGVGELVHRSAEPAPEPAQLMADAVRDALSDSGAGDVLLRRAGVLGAVPPVAWPDGDPGRRAAELLGIDGVRTVRTSMQGGNGPQLLVNVLAGRIQDGELDVAIVCGAEALSTFTRLVRAGETPPWPAADQSRAPGEVLEDDRPAATEAEQAVGMLAPIRAYPLIENAIRAAAGRAQDEHLDRIAALWSRFSAVAEQQPAAWTPRAYTREELATATDGNRRITLPYTKLLNANIQVDQAAALVLCSAQAARDAGVPPDRWVFLHAGARATDEWFLSERRELHRSPAIRACGRALFEHTGTTPDELGPVDLYSCFPAAVQLAAAELGLPADDLRRELTCTGGLTFFGGPGNDYATHGIAAVARRLREAPEGTLGLATALGWYATKHALGLYGNAPPQRPYAALEPQPDHPQPREVAGPLDAAATAETCTVVYERDGSASHGILFALLDDGRRAVACTGDARVLAAMAEDGFLGSRVTLRADRTFVV
jgi:acetyl-CoA C-acetyltransferase